MKSLDQVRAELARWQPSTVPSPAGDSFFKSEYARTAPLSEVTARMRDAEQARLENEKALGSVNAELILSQWLESKGER